MGTKHKHYDVIVAWAAGEEIQFGGDDCGPWTDWNKEYAPSFDLALGWRIKPKTVKREGWVNVYKPCTGIMHSSKEKADQDAMDGRVACIRIEWEEEQ